MTAEDEDDEPKAALLTKAQRKLIRGEKEYRGEVGSEMRRRIRRRVETALGTDFPLLVDEFEIDDLVEGDPVPVSPTALRDTIAFAFLLAEASGLNAEMLVDDAVEQAERSRAEVIREKLAENPRDVTIGELQDLRRAGDLTRDEYDALVRETTREPPGRVGSLDEIEGLDLSDDE